MFKVDINLQDIQVSNATQRTISILGAKGAGKTTLIKMLMMQEKPMLVLDPLSVIKSKSIDALRIVLKTKDIDDDRIRTVMKVVNETLRKGNNVVLSFDNMVQEEEIILANMIFPLIAFKDGWVVLDEVHEFVPLYSGSTEVQRFIRHCRNKNIGVIQTSQRPASVHKNVLALTDYLVVLRMTWTHDLQAIKDLLKDILPRDEVNKIISELPKLGFLEGYAVDYRSGDS